MFGEEHQEDPTVDLCMEIQQVFIFYLMNINFKLLQEAEHCVRKRTQVSSGETFA